MTLSVVRNLPNRSCSCACLSGPASDVLGRRVVIVPGVVLSGVASLVMLFGGASRQSMLYLGRFLLGVVSGIVFVVGSAWTQEVGSSNPMLTTRQIAAVMFASFGAGPLIAGVAGQWSSAPLVIPYLIHLVLVMLGMWLIREAPETVTRNSTRKIRPNLGMPRGTGRDFFVGDCADRIRRLWYAIPRVWPVPSVTEASNAGIAVLISGVLGFVVT